MRKLKSINRVGRFKIYKQMKFNLFFTFAISLLVITNVFAGPGDFSFGSETNPEMVLKTSDPGYQQFTDQVVMNVNGGTVDWAAVSDGIKDYPSLVEFSNWLDENEGAAYVFVHCGDGCHVVVPNSCDWCGGEATQFPTPW